jgi:hypothetical protein
MKENKGVEVIRSKSDMVWADPGGGVQGVRTPFMPKVPFFRPKVPFLMVPSYMFTQS